MSFYFIEIIKYLIDFMIDFLFQFLVREKICKKTKEMNEKTEFTLLEFLYFKKVIFLTFISKALLFVKVSVCPFVIFCYLSLNVCPFIQLTKNEYNFQIYDSRFRGLFQIYKFHIHKTRKIPNLKLINMDFNKNFDNFKIPAKSRTLRSSVSLSSRADLHRLRDGLRGLHRALRGQLPQRVSAESRKQPKNFHFVIIQTNLDRCKNMQIDRFNLSENMSLSLS